MGDVNSFTLLFTEQIIIFYIGRDFTFQLLMLLRILKLSLGTHMTLTVSFFYLRSKSLFLWITWFHFFWMLMIWGPLKFELWTFCTVDIFNKILHFYPTLKNGGSKHDFFVVLNAPVGVHERIENLLTRIGIRDLSFWDKLFFIICMFLKIWLFTKLVLHKKYYLWKYQHICVYYL